MNQQIYILTVAIIAIAAIPLISKLFIKASQDALGYQKRVLDGLESIGQNVETVAKYSGYTLLIVENKINDLYEKYRNTGNNTLVETMLGATELVLDKMTAMKAVSLSIYFNKECDKLLNSIERMNHFTRVIWYLLHFRLTPSEYLGRRFKKLTQLSEGLKEVNEKYGAENKSWAELKEMEKELNEKLEASRNRK